MEGFTKLSSLTWPYLTIQQSSYKYKDKKVQIGSLPTIQYELSNGKLEVSMTTQQNLSKQRERK